ncbi:hypothetical protein BH23THE1_BH23THE1_33280 [soil metagenome]
MRRLLSVQRPVPRVNVQPRLPSHNVRQKLPSHNVQRRGLIIDTSKIMNIVNVRPELHIKFHAQIAKMNNILKKDDMKFRRKMLDADYHKLDDRVMNHNKFNIKDTMYRSPWEDSMSLILSPPSAIYCIHPMISISTIGSSATLGFNIFQSVADYNFLGYVGTMGIVLGAPLAMYHSLSRYCQIKQVANILEKRAQYIDLYREENESCKDDLS